MTLSRSSMAEISWEKGESPCFRNPVVGSDQVGSLFSLLERTDDLETSTSRSISHFKIGEISADLQPRTPKDLWTTSTRCQTTRRRYSRPNQLAGGLFRLIPPLSFLGLGDTVSSFPFPVVVSSPWFICGGIWTERSRIGIDLDCGPDGHTGSILIGWRSRNPFHQSRSSCLEALPHTRISLPHWRLGVYLWPSRSILTRR